MHLFSPTQGTALHLETRFHSHDAGIVSRPLRHIFLCQTGWLLQQTVFIMQCNALKPCHHCYTYMAFRIIYPLMPCSADRNSEFFSNNEFDRIWHMRLYNIQNSNVQNDGNQAMHLHCCCQTALDSFSLHSSYAITLNQGPLGLYCCYLYSFMTEPRFLNLFFRLRRTTFHTPVSMR